MGSTKRILIVDDNVDAADLTAQVLRMNGLTVDVAYGGPEGLAAAHKIAPNVIFLDIGMPVMDGYKVAEALRADKAFVDVKLVALTAWGDHESRLKTKEAGFDMHLVKPANLATLIDIVGPAYS